MGILEFILLLPALIVALTIHEFAHAVTADRLGDQTPRLQGRVTLNPIAHLDPVGSLVLLFTAFAPGPTFGWGKPVQFNPANLDNPKRDIGLVAFAGPISNIIMAVVFTGVYAFINQGVIGTVLLQFILLNVILAAFNMIPIYPLDGFNVVFALLPDKLSSEFYETSNYGIWILLLLLLTDALDIILSPVLQITLNILNTVT